MISLSAASTAFPSLTRDRHPEWFAQRMAINELGNRSETSDEDATRLAIQEDEIEQRLLHTPARTVAEAKVKLRLAATIHREGFALDADDASELLAELAEFFA